LPSKARQRRLCFNQNDPDSHWRDRHFHSPAILAGWLIGKNLTRPLTELTETAEKIAAGNLSLRAKTVPPERGSPDEIASLAIAFNSMTAQLRNLVENLEERVATRTRQLQNRSEQLTAAADVGRSATTILDNEQLIQHVVDLIQERFNLYYVGLFLVDETREWAVLQAGTGLAGQTMLGRGHRLPVSESSMIGWSITNGLARIALEAGEDPVRLATPELRKRAPKQPFRFARAAKSWRSDNSERTARRF